MRDRTRQDDGRDGWFANCLSPELAWAYAEWLNEREAQRLVARSMTPGELRFQAREASDGTWNVWDSTREHPGCNDLGWMSLHARPFMAQAEADRLNAEEEK